MTSTINSEINIKIKKEKERLYVAFMFIAATCEYWNGDPDEL
jgi:hypothetical protein